MSRGHDHNGECRDCDEPWGYCTADCDCDCRRAGLTDLELDKLIRFLAVGRWSDVEGSAVILDKLRTLRAFK